MASRPPAAIRTAPPPRAVPEDTLAPRRLTAAAMMRLLTSGPAGRAPRLPADAAGAVGDLLRETGTAAGNQALASLLDEPAAPPARPAATVSPADTVGPAALDSPPPADPAGTVAEDTPDAAAPAVPSHTLDGGSTSEGPPARPGVAVPTGGGVLAPDAASPDAARASAAATAAAMPSPPAPAGAASLAPPARAPRSRAAAARRIAGPPPVPMVEPSFADLPDPIAPATARIEEVANRILPAQSLPALQASPGGHLPILAAPEHPISDEDRRLIVLGEAAMDRAGLSREGGTPGPNEETAGETRARLSALRTQLLAPPTPAADGAPPAPVARPVVTVTAQPLPPSEITVAEQQLFARVLARTIVAGEAGGEAVLHDIKRDMRNYPNDTLNSPYHPALVALGHDRVTVLTTRITDRANATARAMGAAGAVLDGAVAARRAVVAQAQAEEAAGMCLVAQDATGAIAATADTRLADAATARGAAADARRRARAGPAPAPGFRAVAEGAVARIQAKVSEAIARFRLQKAERARELDAARDRVIAGYDLAVAADRVAAERAEGLGPGQTPPATATMLAVARGRVNAAHNSARMERNRHVRDLEAAVDRLKASANAICDANIVAVEDEGAAAFRALRDWGATEDGAAEAWWAGTVADLDRWADAAHATATTWAEAEGRLARLEMQRDLARQTASIERAIRRDAEQAAGYAQLTEDRRRDYVATILSDAREPDFIDRMNEDVRRREVAAARAEIEPEVERQLMALPRDQWEAVEYAAKALNSGFNARERASAIKTAGYDKWVSTDEATIYSNLEGLRPIELAAVTKCYGEIRGSDTALYDDLDHIMSGDEWRRAQALMSGDVVAAAAEAIHDAAWGPGTNEPQIRAALRSIETLPEGERSAARSRLNTLYMQRYDVSLDTVLANELSGSELGEGRALAEGDMAAAEAYEMDYALSGGFFGPDAGAAAAVYERIRTESMAAARANPQWTSADFEAEVARRNAALGASFQTRFANETDYSWGSGTALENAVSFRFRARFDRGNRDMLTGFATGDMTLVDAGRMRAEQDGTYADDEVMGAVVRAQHARALDRVQLDEGPELRAGIDARLHRERSAPGAPRDERHWIDRRMALTREMDATIGDRAFDVARESTAALDRRLIGRYGTTLDAMLTDTMSNNTFGSGGALSDAQARLEIMRRTATTPEERRARRLDWAYQRVRFGIEGVGTDTGELRGGLEGLDRAEMRELDARWQRDHPGETMRAAVEDDTSGREEGDLVDIVEHGTPTTTAERVDELRRRLDRDERGVGSLGAAASLAEARQSRAALARLEALSADLDNPNLSPERRAHLSRTVDQRVETTRAAIDAQRAAVDSFADNITTILQYVVGAVAIVLGAILAVVTGGTAVPALIAIAGSVIGTLSGMAAKAAIKGSAYGAEEITTDLVVGAVDLVVTLATVGAFKGAGKWAAEGGRTLLSAAREGLRTAGRASVRATLRQAAGRTVATAAERAVAAGTRQSIPRRAAAFAGAFALEQGKDMIRSVPTALAGAMMNEENWRHGNFAGNMARGTWEASLENLKNGAVMGLAGHGVNLGVGRFMQVTHRPMTPVEALAADYARFRAANPRATHAEFVAHMEADAAAASADAAAVQAATRAARRELLSELPPAERRAIADVPILHVGDAQFRALNGGNFADAIIHVHEGQAVIVVREGAPASAVRGIATDLRQIVQPGTAGRTVNPADSLPPRLRNRVAVEVVRDPGFGLDEVRAVPQRDRHGNIVGVALRIGPNAHAADIQNHVGTIDAMRRYAGLAGRARLLLNDFGRAVGMDLVSPREQGRWEAALEVAKLPRIIEDRMTRLSEHGLDPRRRALVMDEIAGLESQLVRERKRLALGADAEARGYVAAESTPRRPSRRRPRRETAAETEAIDGPAQRSALSEEGGGPAQAEVAPARSAADQASLDFIAKIEAQRRIVNQAEIEIDAAEPAGFTKHNNAVREGAHRYRTALREIAAQLPDGPRRAIRELGINPTPSELAAIRAMLVHPDHVAAYDAATERLSVNDRKAVNRIGAHLDAINARTKTLQTQAQVRDDALAEIGRLNAEYEAQGGKTFHGVPRHPSLPPPAVDLTYKPEEGFRKNLQNEDGMTSSQVDELFHAVREGMRGNSAPADAIVSPAGLVRFAPMTEARIRHKMAQLRASRNGYIAELNLANEVAATDQLSVVHYGHPSGRNFADVIGVVPEGANKGDVTLFDSKYRGGGSAPPHSDTFTSPTNLAGTLSDAKAAIRKSGLDQDVIDRAIENLDAGNFTAITAHTNDGVNFTRRTMKSENHVAKLD